MFWTIFNYLLSFVCAVAIVGGAVFGWFFALCLLKGWVFFDDGKYSNFD